MHLLTIIFEGAERKGRQAEKNSQSTGEKTCKAQCFPKHEISGNIYAFLKEYGQILRCKGSCFYSRKMNLIRNNIRTKEIIPRKMAENENLAGINIHKPVKRT